MSDQTCIICGRRLNVEADELSVDCGGDCWGCIGEIEADMGYKPSLKMVMDEWRRGLRPNWTPPSRPDLTRGAERDGTRTPMTVVMKPCKVPWSISPSMSGLTLTYVETDVVPECAVVLGGGRMGPDGLTDRRRIEVQFVMACHVRATRIRDDEDLEACGFQFIGGYEGPSEGYLNWRERRWRDTGLCPNSGFYVALESAWLRAARNTCSAAPKHFVLVGREGFIEIIAESFSWREWLWQDGLRDRNTNASDVVGSGQGAE